MARPRQTSHRKLEARPGSLTLPGPRSQNVLRHTAVATGLDTLVVVRRLETDVAEGGNSEELANLYEFLILNRLSVPADLDQNLREAHRRVHLRGLDPLRKTA